MRELPSVGLFTHAGENSSTQKAGGARSWSGRFREDRVLPLYGIEPLFLGHLARSLVTDLVFSVLRVEFRKKGNGFETNFSHQGLPNVVGRLVG